VDAEIAEAKTAMEAASAQVEAAKRQETLAFDEFNAKKQAVLDARRQLGEVQLARSDVEKTIALLELQGDCVATTQSVEDAKLEAAKAAEAARQAALEAKAKEREAVDAAKAARGEVRAKENEALREIHERQLAIYVTVKGQGRDKLLKADAREAEKRCQEREKRRALKLKETMGLGNSRDLAKRLRHVEPVVAGLPSEVACVDAES